MPYRRLPAAALTATLACALALAGCTSSGSSGTPSSRAPSSRATPSAGAAGPSADAKKLADSLDRALATATSAHLDVASTIAGDTVDGSGDLGLKAGAIDAADLEQQLPSGLGSVRIIVADGTTYAKLPAGFASSTKPWAVLDAGSSNLVVSQIAATVQPVLALASPKSFAEFVRAASSVTTLGSSSVAGTAVTTYRVVVDPKRLPSDFPSGVTAAAGATDIPVQLAVDGRGRPVRVSGTFIVNGQQLTPTATLTKYNEPVSITAPPAGQVAAG